MREINVRIILPEERNKGTEARPSVQVVGLTDEELGVLGQVVLAKQGAELVGFDTNPSQAGAVKISASEEREFRILASFFNRLAAGRWLGYREEAS